MSHQCREDGITLPAPSELPRSPLWNSRNLYHMQKEFHCIYNLLTPAECEYMIANHLLYYRVEFSYMFASLTLPKSTRSKLAPHEHKSLVLATS